MSFYLYVTDCYSNSITLQEAIYFQINNVIMTFYHTAKSRLWPARCMEGSSDCSALAVNYMLMSECGDICSLMQQFTLPNMNDDGILV